MVLAPQPTLATSRSRPRPGRAVLPTQVGRLAGMFRAERTHWAADALAGTVRSGAAHFSKITSALPRRTFFRQ